jgi:hypothetical protein
MLLHIFGRYREHQTDAFGALNIFFASDATQTKNKKAIRIYKTQPFTFFCMLLLSVPAVGSAKADCQKLVPAATETKHSCACVFPAK